MVWLNNYIPKTLALYGLTPAVLPAESQTSASAVGTAQMATALSGQSAEVGLDQLRERIKELESMQYSAQTTSAMPAQPDGQSQSHELQELRDQARLIGLREEIKILESKQPQRQVSAKATEIKPIWHVPTNPIHFVKHVAPILIL